MTFFVREYFVTNHGNKTEEDIRSIVNKPRDFLENRFELKEGPPLKIRATWGHTIPVNVTVSVAI